MTITECPPRYEVNLPAPELVQVTSQKVMEEQCEQRPLCVIAFLPHILDCQSKCRNDYLQMLTAMGDKFKKQVRIFSLPCAMHKATKCRYFFKG